MSISEDQPTSQTKPKGSGGNLQSKHIERDTEGKDKRNESEQAPPLEAAADQSSQ